MPRGSVAAEGHGAAAVAAMRRIAVIGSPGAGKSTLSRRLGAVLDLPVHHLDRLYWHAGWVPTSRERWERLQRELLRGDRWIVDGNYGATMGLRLEAADTVVWLDYAPAICLWRAVRRVMLHRGRSRADMADGCPERIDVRFLRFVWRFGRDSRPGIAARLQALRRGVVVVRLQSSRQGAAFVRAVERSVVGQRLWETMG